MLSVGLTGQAMANSLPESSSPKYIKNPCLCCSWEGRFGFEQFFPKKSKQLLRVGPASSLGSLGTPGKWAAWELGTRPQPGCECAGFKSDEGHLKPRSRQPKPLSLIYSLGPQISSLLAHLNPPVSSSLSQQSSQLGNEN